MPLPCCPQLLALALIGLSACSSSTEPKAEPRRSDRPAQLEPNPPTPATPTPAPEPEQAPEAKPPPLAGEGPSLWRPPPDPRAWQPRLLRQRSPNKLARPLAASRPRRHRVGFGHLAWLGDELLSLGSRDGDDVIYRFSAAGELLGVLELDALGGEISGERCNAELSVVSPLIVSPEGWLAFMVSCTTEDSRWLVYLDAQGRRLDETRVELWLGASYTLAGRHVVLSFRHENNFDTLLRGYSVAGDAPWSREYEDKLSNVTGVGDRLVCYDFDDNWVVLDPRDGSEIATYPLAGDLHLPSFAPLGEREVALIRDELVAIFELETGVERRRLRLQFEDDEYRTVNELWPGPGGGYWVVRGIFEGAKLWLVDREGKPLERVVEGFGDVAVTELEGRWLWAAQADELKVPNTASIPPRPEDSLAELLVLGDVRAE